MTTDFPTAPAAYGLEGPSAAVTVEKSIHASHTEILTPPAQHIWNSTFMSFKCKDPVKYTLRYCPAGWLKAIRLGSRDRRTLFQANFVLIGYMLRI